MKTNPLIYILIYIYIHEFIAQGKWQVRVQWDYQCPDICGGHLHMKSRKEVGTY